MKCDVNDKDIKDCCRPYGCCTSCNYTDCREGCEMYTKYGDCKYCPYTNATFVCKEDFQLPKVEEDGDISEDMLTVRKGSVWEITEDNLLGCDIHMECLTGNHGWIEFDKEDLNKYFELIEDGDIA